MHNDTDFLLTWVDNSSNEDGFEIHESLDSVDNFGLLLKTDANENSAILSDKDSQYTYYYRVFSYRGYDHSVSSNIIAMDIVTNTVPDNPSALNIIEVTESTVTLEWQDNSYDELGFHIERSDSSMNWIQVAELGTNIIVYKDIGLDSATEYYYRAKSYNNIGESESSNVINVTTILPTIPNAPSALSASNITISSVTLSWQDNSYDEHGFRIERKLLSGSWDIIAETGTNVELYTDNGLQPNIDYVYRIYSFNEIGESDYSNECHVETEAVTLITVLSPNGGESYSISETMNITWNAGQVGFINIKLMKNGVVWRSIASGTGNDGLYNWNISDAVGTGDDFKIEVISNSDEEIYDESDSSFTITE